MPFPAIRRSLPPASKRAPKPSIRIRRDLGLDRPLPEQFATFLGNALQGELGTSIRTGSPVAQEIAERLPYTIQLAAWSVLVAVLIGVAAGGVAAVYHTGRSITW